jgi:hypothetical protein
MISLRKYNHLLFQSICEDVYGVLVRLKLKMRGLQLSGALTQLLCHLRVVSVKLPPLHVCVFVCVCVCVLLLLFLLLLTGVYEASAR